MTIIKDTTVAIDKYFTEREYAIKNNMAELLFIWSIHNKFIQEQIDNKNIIDRENKRLGVEEYKPVKQNELNIIKYEMENLGNFNSVEENTKSVGDSKKK